MFAAEFSWPNTKTLLNVREAHSDDARLFIALFHPHEEHERKRHIDYDADQRIGFIAW